LCLKRVAGGQCTTLEVRGIHVKKFKKIQEWVLQKKKGHFDIPKFALSQCEETSQYSTIQVQIDFMGLALN
jgi:hypothetical protein